MRRGKSFREVGYLTLDGEDYMAGMTVVSGWVSASIVAWLPWDCAEARVLRAMSIVELMT